MINLLVWLLRAVHKLEGLPGLVSSLCDETELHAAEAFIGKVLGDRLLEALLYSMFNYIPCT
jgi:hypothetical protein